MTRTITIAAAAVALSACVVCTARSQPADKRKTRPDARFIRWDRNKDGKLARD